MSKTLVELWNENITATDYTQNQLYQEHLFEQYMMYVETAERLTSKRRLANTFFVTLHTLLVSAAGFAFGTGSQFTDKWLIAFPLAALLGLCYVWWRLLKWYKQMHSAKYKVIGEYERHLPSSPLASAEWKALGEGNNPKLFKAFADVEHWAPISFAVLYVVGAAVIILT